MRKLWMLFFAFAVALSFGIIDSTLADQKDDMDKMKAEAMAKWQAYATPGDGHKIMWQLEGNWNYSLKYWTSPNAPPEESTGTNDVKWILGNRFLEMNVKGTSMGQPFEGMGILGYDNAKKEYTSTWIDTMGTGMMNATGSYDPGTKSMTEVGKFTDPMSGEQSFKGITKFVDTDNFTYEMFISIPTGEEFRVMEINYTRKK
ncbi:MAG: DUF1579 domain-containing protein [Deltaproteobacteria bacterium]|nr:DUF1579 domain-containing protein [Deltaproteobacteria bacterium]MCK5710383.1 DUF1579 domain-containing protein [Deltaproteobacteria bacterium]